MNKKLPLVSILLSTYNGSNYLPALIDSLLNQNYPNFIIYIRDDFSLDNTMNIISEYKSDNIIVIDDSYKNLGPAQSFLRLLEYADSDIYMFCDQDDIWLHDKISLSVEAIMRFGIENSILYHSDLVVVDSDLNILNSSFMASINYNNIYSLKDYCLQNYVVGCTMAITNSLKKSMLKNQCFRSNIAMHDWWIAIWAKCFGFVIYDSSTPILYRQHCSNTVGVTGGGFISKLFVNKLSDNIAKIANYKSLIGKQACDFIQCYNSELSRVQMNILLHTSKISKSSWFFSFIRCFLYGIRFKRYIMNILFLIIPPSIQ